MSVTTLWTVLGIEPTQDVTLIRRAYAGVLKRIIPEEDPTGFAALRQAYEQAMMLARSVGLGTPGVPVEPVAAARVEPVSATPEPATAPDISRNATVQPTPLDQLRGSFLALQQAATTSGASDPDTLKALLDACLNSPALENLSIQLEFEPAIVRFFAQTLPRTQSLLETVITHWKWRDRPRSAAGGAIAALVSHADNLWRLEQLRDSSPRAYRALTRPPRLARLWFELVFRGLDTSVREALEQFRNVAPGVFNPLAQAWWHKFFTEPHVRPVWLRAAGVLALVGCFAGGVVGMDGDRPGLGIALGGVAGLLSGLALAGLWLGLIDWPRYRLSATRRAAPPSLRLGWAAAAGIACIVSTFSPDGLPGMLAALAVSLVLLVWVIIMAPAFRNSATASVMSRIWTAIVVNVPLGVWWVLLNVGPTAPPTLTMSVIFIGTVFAFAIGQSLLWVEFLHDLNRSQRQQARAGVAAVALAALALLLLTRIGSDGNHLLLMCLVLVVLAHRTPALNLTVEQVKVRHYVTVVPAVVVARMLDREDMASILQLGGILFMAGVLLSMGVCIYNDWKASREGDPSPA